MDKLSCDLISCNAMMDLENIGHEKQFAKRVTQIGGLDQMLWLVEVPSTLGSHLLISSQPFIRCS